MIKDKLKKMWDEGNMFTDLFGYIGTKQFMLYIFTIFAAPVLTYYIMLKVLHIIYYRQKPIWLDFSNEVMSLNNNAGWKLFGLLLFAIFFSILCNIFSIFTKNKIRRRLTRDEKKRYSELISENELLKRLDADSISYGTNYEQTKKPTFSDDKKKGGVIIASHEDRIYTLDDYIHSIYVGTTKSGKTESILFPQLQVILDSEENAVMTDPKGTLYAEYGWRFKERGYKVYRINFVDPVQGDYRNPFQNGIDAWHKAEKEYEVAKKKYSKDIENIAITGGDIEEYKKNNPSPCLNSSQAIEYWKNVADILTNEEHAKDPFWNNEAANLIIGGAVFLAEIGKVDCVNITSIRRLYDDIEQFQDFMKNNYNPETTSFSLLSSMINGASDTAKSIVSVFKSKTTLLALSNDMEMMTSNTTVDFLDLTRGKCVIFFQCHDEKATYFPLMSLYIEQIYQELVEASRIRLSEGKSERLPICINFLFEEFGIMSRLPSIKTMIGACRSRGIRLYFFLQDFLQLYDTYGRDIANNIVSQCQHMIYLLSGDEQTKKDICAKAGTTLKWNRDTGSWQEKPTISIDQLNDLEIGDFITLFQRVKGCCKHHFAYYKNANYYYERPKDNIEERKYYKKPENVYTFINELKNLKKIFPSRTISTSRKKGTTWR